jgi:3'(2'), 5'-bisphosphate nucleotidase
MIDLEFVGELAMEAGREILDVYGTDFGVERKDDDSPITLADRRSHQLIVRELRSRHSDIPVLSEEGKEVPYETRRNWDRFWLVDPLDGTKEFVKRNGEFTVNIALIERGRPSIGVIYLPVAKRLYVAKTNEGCREIEGQSRREIRVAHPVSEGSIRMVKSRSHPSPNLEAILEILPPCEIVKRGSALKFCAVAAGQADFYPRFGPTWEWDTAAGQAIVEAAGGVVVDFQGRPFRYNKPNLINGPFLVASSLEWLRDMGVLERASTLKLD